MPVNMKEMEARWNAAREKAKEMPEVTGGGFPGPDGRYIGRLYSVEKGVSGSGNEQVVWTINTKEPEEFKGEIARKYDRLETENNLIYHAKTLMIFGYDIDQIGWRGLDKVYKEITKKKPFVRFRVVTSRKEGKEEYQNIYIDRALPDYESEDDDDEPKISTKPSRDSGNGRRTKPEAQVDEDEDEDEENEETPREAQPGMECEFEYKGEEKQGVIKEVLEDEGKIRIECEGKVYKISADKVSVFAEDELDKDDDEDEEEEEDEKPVRVGRK